MRQDFISHPGVCAQNESRRERVWETPLPGNTTSDTLAHQQLLKETLLEIFGELDPELLSRLWPKLQMLELPGGSVLMRQGDASDAMYLVLAGRLQASIQNGGPVEQVLREIGRGEPIGEMGVISGEPRSATVRALRDCILARLDGQDFIEALQSWPKAGLALARKLIERLSHHKPATQRQRVINLCVLPLHPQLDAALLAERLQRTLAHELGRAGRPDLVALHTRESVETALGPGASDADSHHPALYRPLLDWLDHQEAGHAMQVFAAEAQDSAWTRLCLRHADQVLLVADADGDVRLHDVERQHLGGNTPSVAVRQSLWLLHPDERTTPTRTARWLHPRPHLMQYGVSHFHCRRNHGDDWRRLARIVSGLGCGIVLAGGGAKGFAHLGVLKALEEHGIDWDMVGGTSIGAIMGAYAALDQPAQYIIDQVKRAFVHSPTGDFNLLPMMSLLRGRRLQRIVADAVVHAVGERIHVEDLWKPFFCVASNYSRAQTEVLRDGDLADALLASVSIPAALPPVLRHGDLLVDGGTFNNYPVDLMRDSGASRVIGIDLSRDRYRPLNHHAVPSPWALFVDRFLRPRAQRRYKGFPSLGAIVFNVAVMASTSHQKSMRELADLSFQPDVSRVGMLDWKAFDRVMELGLKHARERLAADTADLSREWYTTQITAHPP